MLEAVFLAAFSGMLGASVRALLEKEKSKFYLYNCIPTGLVMGIYSLFYNPFTALPPTTCRFFGAFFIFFMASYVLSDIIDSIVFILKARRKR